MAMSPCFCDVVLCDYSMPHLDAPSALRVLRESGVDDLHIPETDEQRAWVLAAAETALRKPPSIPPGWL